jgi:hypothetical protein
LDNKPINIVNFQGYSHKFWKVIYCVLLIIL